MTANDAISLYRADLAKVNPEMKEFPVTRMSAGVALATAYLLTTLGAKVPRHRALDVGAGCGILTAILALYGCEDVLGIDINAVAVAAADARFVRLAAALAKLSCGPITKPIFKQRNVVDVSAEKQSYDIIVTNPPSYLTSKRGDSPLDAGLYDTLGKVSLDPKDSFLYQFFERVVGPRLAPGGLMICAWPALQARLVHQFGDAKQSIAHPATLLEKWFGWSISPAAEQRKAFFSVDVPVAYPGADHGFSRELEKQLGRGLYSSLVRPGSPATQFRPTFRYGVLALVRDLNLEDHFHIQTVDPDVYQERS
jgi:SAM-dependent methyltransferase